MSNSFKIIASSSSGLASTRIRQAISNSDKCSIPASFIPSRKLYGLKISRTVRSGKSSGTASFENMPRTDLPLAFIKSDVFIKIDSAISSMRSSSAVERLRTLALLFRLRLNKSERGEPSDPSEWYFQGEATSIFFVSLMSIKNSLKLMQIVASSISLKQLAVMKAQCSSEKVLSNLEHRSRKASKGSLTSSAFSSKIQIRSGSITISLISFIITRARLGLINSYFGIAQARSQIGASLT